MGSTISIDIAVDENNAIRFATTDACVTPEVSVAKTSVATGPINPDGTFTQEFSIRYEVTGDLSIQLPTLLDDVETAFGAAYDPSTVTANSASGVIAGPTLDATGVVDGTPPSVNANFDGDTNSDLLDGTPADLQPGDFFEVNFTTLIDSSQLNGATVNTVVADGLPPGAIALPVVGVDENGSATTGTASSSFFPPTGSPSLTMTKVADSEGPHTVGDVVTYTYTVTNDGDINVRNTAISDTHNGSDPAPTPGNETLLTDVAPLGDSSDAAVDGSWDVLAPGDTVTFTGTYTITATDVVNLQ